MMHYFDLQEERIIKQEDYLLIWDDKSILLMHADSWEPDHKHIFLILAKINEW